MDAPELVDGALPMGRWCLTEAEARSYCATADESVRKAIWAEWEQLTAAVRSAVEVAACWLGGSFFTDKETPGDLDCVYIIDAARLTAARQDEQRAQFLQIVGSNGVKQQFDLRVDSFILHWLPSSGPGYGGPDRRQGYLQPRGYWDDLWSRTRHSDHRLDAIPCRGYLEVVLDGYR